MAINGSLSGISFSGLSSGIDTDGIISRLMQLEQIPISRLQSRQQAIQQQQSVFGQFRSKLQALSGAAGALNNNSAFNPVSATSSKPEVATLTATSEALAGIYTLAVSKLAQAHKVASVAQQDSTSALNKAGQFVVNGKAITVDATDSLRTIAQKVNSAGAGVTASIIDGGAGASYLTITANATGAKKSVQLSDLSGDSIIGSMGMTSGSYSIRESIANGASSVAFNSNSTSIQSLMNASGLGAATIDINGVQVALDLSTDSLQTVADKINAAGTGATASVKSVVEGSTTTYKLEIVGGSGAPVMSGVGGNALSALGILQQDFGNQLVGAQDAEYSLDGVQLSSATNTITTAIPNATFTLLKGNATTPETTVLSLTKDVKAIKEKVDGFKAAYNDAIDFIRTYSQFDKDTFQSGPLFGDPIAAQLEQQVSSLLFNNVPGLTGNFQNLASIGFNLDETGKLTLDDSALTNALSTNPTAVSDLFKTSGLASNSSFSYISSTSKSVSSGLGAYDVTITALATKGSYTAEIAQTSASGTAELLTFSGAQFGSTPYVLTIGTGSTLTATVDRINSDSKLKELVLASIDASGRLVIESKRFGTGGNFTVTSNLAAAADNSGIGTASAGVTVSGTNIEGTINGEPATGNGQFLSGNSGNATTDGLQVLYTGTATGSIGTISLRKGIGPQVTDLMSTFLDSVSGILTASDNTLKSQYEDIGDQIEDLMERLSLKEADLRAKFTRMEEAISRIQSQASRLAALNQPSNSG